MTTIPPMMISNITLLFLIVLIYLVNLSWSPWIFIYYIKTDIETDKLIYLLKQEKWVLTKTRLYNFSEVSYLQIDLKSDTYNLYEVGYIKLILCLKLGTYKLIQSWLCTRWQINIVIPFLPGENITTPTVSKGETFTLRGINRY